MKIENLNVMDLSTDSRETMGDRVPLFFYRYLSLFAVADAMGASAKSALFDAGYKIGSQLVRDKTIVDFQGLAEHYLNNGLGIVSLKSEAGSISHVVVEECATCTGLPPVETALCFLDGGILAGTMQALARSPEAYGAREVECSGLGHSACLFAIGPSSKIDVESGSP